MQNPKLHPADFSREARFGPRACGRIPHTRSADLLVSDDDIEKTIIVHVQQAHPVVQAVRSAQGLPCEEVLVHSLLRFPEVEELYFFAMLPDGVVDKLDHLFWRDPAMRMKNKRECALLDHRSV